MTDLAIQFTDAGGDLILDKGDLVVDTGLQAAVTVSLYSDRRASEQDQQRLGLSDARGCWWDTEADRHGSKLWLLAREKQLEAVRRQAQEHAIAALAWMQEVGISSRVEVTSQWVSQGVLCLEIRLFRGTNRRWDHLWRGLTIFEAQFGGFESYRLDSGPGVEPLNLSYGSALNPTGTPLNFGSAANPTGPAINLGGA